jgi:hypothetical protein
MSDKRKVSTDALETLGMIHERDEKRDAIHLAVLPVKAGQKLTRGNHIEVRDGVARAVPSGHPKAVGIVDPFLTVGVDEGERFWLLLYPRTIQSLRHVWSHPAFPDEAAAAPSDSETESAKAAIREVADDLGVSYDVMMAGAKTWLSSNGWDGYMCFGDDLSYSWDMDRFWDAYALLTGEQVHQEKRTSFFRCAC